jgi:hypothetical protein
MWILWIGLGVLAVLNNFPTSDIVWVLVSGSFLVSMDFVIHKKIEQIKQLQK